MNAKRLRVLAITAATGRVGYVFFIGDELKDWHISRKASKNTKEVRGFACKWISSFAPDILITEVTDSHSRKGQHSKRLIRSVVAVAKQANIEVISLPKIKTHKNKFEAAKALVEKYPQIKEQLPEQPKIWMPEPRNVTLFEALALVQSFDLSEA